MRMRNHASAFFLLRTCISLRFECPTAALFFLFFISPPFKKFCFVIFTVCLTPHLAAAQLGTNGKRSLAKESQRSTEPKAMIMAIMDEVLT